MIRVVRFTHQNVRCAVPATQVSHIASDRNPVRELKIFHQELPPASGERPRTVRVQTPDGERDIGCRSARFHAFVRAQVHPLTDVLRDAIGLPHVVGIAFDEESGDASWLVDFSRLAPSSRDSEQES